MGEDAQGTVLDISDGVATVMVDGEEWYFPCNLLPDEIDVDDVVLLTGSGRDFHVVGRDPLRTSVESRLARTERLESARLRWLAVAG